MSKDGAEAADRPSWLTRFFARLRALFDPTPPLHTLYASRVLPYTSLELYDLITDIPSYPQFLPYVTSARVIKWSPRADEHQNRRCPATIAIQAELAGQRESMTGSMFCSPPKDERSEAIVEAFGGSAVPVVTPEHYDAYTASPQPPDGPVRTVRAEWSVKEVEQGKSQVRLRVEFAFRSQVFEKALGTSMAKKLTDQVADAFEKRAKEVLGKQKQSG